MVVKVYRYEALTGDTFLVKRVDEKLPKTSKERYQEYIVSLKGTNWLCSCKGFYYTKKCKHLKFLLSQLMDKGGIIDFSEVRKK